MKKAVVVLMIVLVSVSPLVRGLFFDVEYSLFLASIALLSFCYAINKLVRKERFHTNKTIIILGSLLVLAYALSFRSTVNIRENIEIILQYLEFMIIFIVLYDYFTYKPGLFFSYLIPPTTITGFCVAIIGLLPMPAPYNFLNGLVYQDRIGSSFQYINTAAFYYALCIILVLTLISATKKPVVNVLFSGMGSVLFLALLYSKSLGGIVLGFGGMFLQMILQPKGHKIKTVFSFILMLLPAVMCYGSYSSAFNLGDYSSAGKWVLYCFLGSIAVSLLYCLAKAIKVNKTLKYITYMTGFVILAGAVYALITYGNIARRIASIDVISELTKININILSVTSRVEYFRDSLKLISENWLFGYGGGGWKSLYQSVQEHYYTAQVVHNQYLQTFVESGILGAVSFLLIVLTGVIYSIRSYIINKEPAIRVFISGLMGIFIAFALHIAIDFDLSYVSMQLFFWLLISASAIFLSGFNKKAEDTSNAINRRPRLGIFGQMLLLLLCIGLFFIRSVNFFAAFNADKGLRLMDNSNYTESVKYYETANSIDPINSDYSSQLAIMYDYFMAKSTTYDEYQSWSQKAIDFAKKSTELDEYFPAYREILTRAYLDSGMPADALASAEKLIEYQPCNPGNYEILAKCYIEAATYYRTIDDDKSAADAIIKCSEIDNNPHVIKTPAIEYYKAKALIIFGRYEKAEALLIGAKKSGEYKFYAEILLYIIHEINVDAEDKTSEYSDLTVDEIKSSVLYQDMEVLLGE